MYNKVYILIFIDEYVFKEILELVDFDLKNSSHPENCPQFHFMPRFVRELPDNGRELLPMCEVLKYLLSSNKKLIEDGTLDSLHKMTSSEWQDFADLVKGNFSRLVDLCLFFSTNQFCFFEK